MSRDVLTELVLASALGALGLAGAIGIRRYLANGSPPDLRAAMAARATHLRKVLRRPARAGKERPRVVVQGPKVRPVVCQICLGRLKEGMEYAKCPCGKTFHITCLVRTGFCPYCDRHYEEGSLGQDLIVKPKLTAGEAARRKAEVRVLWEPTERHCPVCGNDLPEGGGECDCGTIVVEEGETFACPSCGTEVPPDSMSCPGCRESFEVVETPLCPICGRLVTSEDGLCECGALATDECPECGTPLEADDLFCPICGTVFEYV
jgi:hypothetical protein